MQVAEKKTGRFMVRFPEGLTLQLRASAIANTRSFQDEIVHRLKITFHGTEAQIEHPRANESNNGLFAEEMSKPLRANNGNRQHRRSA